MNGEQMIQPAALQLARTGDFRAIAYWLNLSLVPQGVFARVAADRPGVLLVLLEFFRLPRRDRLNQVVCQRLLRLNSRLIDGVRIITRFADSNDIQWDTSIRLRSPRKAAPQPRLHRPSAPALTPRVSRSHRNRRATPASAPRPLVPTTALPPHRRTRRSAPIPLTAAPRTTASLTAATVPLSSQRRRPPTARPSASRRKLRRRRAAVVTPALARWSRQVLLQSTRYAFAAADSLELQMKRAIAQSTRYAFIAADTLEEQARAIAQSAQQLPPAQVKMLATTAAAVFLLGIGAEMIRPQLMPPQSGRTARVQPAPPNATANRSADAPITLTFSGNPLLNPSQLPPLISPPSFAEPSAGSFTSSSESSPATASSVPGAAPIESMQTPDVYVSNLDQPLDVYSSTEGIAAIATIQAMQDAGVGIVNVSNASFMKDGEGDLLKTIDSLKEVGIRPIGAGRNQHEARRPQIIEVRGKRIGYLSYSEGDEFAAGLWRAGMNPALHERITKDVADMQGRADWTVVNYHWNQDLSSYPADWQVTLGRLAIDHGADLVVGYHPQALQGGEIYKGRAIAYSLGNFVFQTEASADSPTAADYDSAVLKVSINQDQMKLEFLPVQVQQSKPAIAQGDKADAILTYLEQASALFPEPMKSTIILDRSTNAIVPAPSPAASPIEEEAPPLGDDPFISYPQAPALSDLTSEDEADPANVVTPDPQKQQEPFTDSVTDPFTDSSTPASGVDQIDKSMTPPPTVPESGEAPAKSLSDLVEPEQAEDGALTPFAEPMLPDTR